MNVLFMTVVDIRSVEERGIYTDLIRLFAEQGHDVYVLSPAERRHGLESQILPTHDDHVQIVKIKTGNIQKTNVIEKGISTVLLEYQLRAGIRKHLANVHFDLVLYSTPPITLTAPIKFVKKRDGARTYLMLKDIFPQNAVDMGMLKKTGLKGLLYRYFRAKEKNLYALSDRIGCMSPANVDYVVQHNPQVDPAKVELCPNAIAVQDMSVTPQARAAIREKYGIPLDKKVFVYGGNLGRPQGIPFLMESLQTQLENPDAYFLIVGSGTEFSKLQAWFDAHKPSNMRLMQFLPKEDYDRMVAACDVGMIFLDHRFTIPNFPSRLLSYMQAKLPVLCCTDPNTDIGKVCQEGGFGWHSESNDPAGFAALVQKAMASDLPAMGGKGFAYLQKEYTAEKAMDIILNIMQNAKA